MANSLGLTEFIVLNVDEDENGRSYMYNVEKASPPSSCPRCGCIGPFYKHSIDERIIQDVPTHGKLCYIRIKARRYKCRDCGSTFQESIDCVSGTDRITIRMREYIQAQCLKDTFSRIAQEHSVSVNTVRRIFQEFVEQNEYKLVYAAPRVLGIDEDHVHKVFRFVVTDPENHRLLDILPDRETASIQAFLARMIDKHNVKVVTMDMYQPYRSIIRKNFPSAKIVVDHFHVVQLVNRRMDEVRKQCMDGMTKAERSRFRHIAKLMKMNREDLSAESLERLKQTFIEYPQLGTAYYLKERIREMYTCHSRREAGAKLQDFLRSVPDDCKPMVIAKKTMIDWAEEIMNYFDYRYTNAYTEYTNKLITELNNQARSLSFEQLRYKVLFTTQATKLPKFNPKKATYKPSGSMSNMTTFSLNYGMPTLENGFYVETDLLFKLLTP